MVEMFITHLRLWHVTNHSTKPKSRVVPRIENLFVSVFPDCTTLSSSLVGAKNFARALHLLLFNLFLPLFFALYSTVRLVEVRVGFQLQTKESCEGVFKAYSLTSEFHKWSWSLSVFWVICFTCKFFTAWLFTKIIFLGFMCWTNWGFFDLRLI